MDIYKRNARWWYDARAEGLGRRPLIPGNARLATDDEQVARVLLAKMIRAHAVRQRAGVSLRPVSLAEFAKKSLKEFESQVSQSHLRNLKADFAKLISSTSLGGKMVDEITRPDVLDYMDERRGRIAARFRHAPPRSNGALATDGGRGESGPSERQPLLSH